MIPIRSFLMDYIFALIRYVFHSKKIFQIQKYRKNNLIGVNCLNFVVKVKLFNIAQLPNSCRATVTCRFTLKQAMRVPWKILVFRAVSYLSMVRSFRSFTSFQSYFPHFTVTSDGFRISRGGGAPTPKMDMKNYYLGIFQKKKKKTT